MGAVTTRQPSGPASVMTTSRSVTLADPFDPLSLQTLTDTVAMNGRTSIAQFDVATRTWTRTSAAGRISTTVLDAAGRVVRSAVPLVLPVEMTYDSHGRISSTAQGTRSHSFAYDAATGYLSGVTDPLSQTVLFQRDAVGRVTRQTLPDQSAIGFAFDPAGNMTSLTPPGNPAHGFTYTPVDLLADYVPPPVSGSGANITHDSYDLDRKLMSVQRPDLATVGFGYDSAGRVVSKTIPGGLLAYGYDSATGKLVSLAGPYGVSVAMGYDGSLLTDVAWSGDVAGTVHWTYDNDFRIASETVNGANPAAFSYDPDGLRTAGDLTRTLDPQNGRLAASSLGAVTDAYTYDSYGALSAFEARYQSTSLYSTAYTRDALGRITTKTETIGGQTHTYGYGYDLRGRLLEVRRDGVVTAHCGYDANGNRLIETVTGQTGTYDDQDRMLSYGDATYAYTANGELTSKTEGGQTTSYVYDVLGNLSHVAKPGAATISVSSFLGPVPRTMRLALAWKRTPLKW